MKLFLIGFMGSGKSTIGKALSESLKFQHIDLDKYLEKKEKQSVTELFSRFGELYFRQKETYYLQKICNYTNTVISLGGGTPCFSYNMEIINSNGISIYLKTEINELHRRLLNKKQNRPLIADLSDTQLYSYIEKKLNEREKFYNQSKIIINTTQKGITEIIEQIINDIFLKQNEKNFEI